MTEGPETFTMSLRTGSSSGPVVATTATITVNDTSLTPVPTYALVPSVTSVNEGSLVAFTVTTTFVADNTLLYYTITGAVASMDFADTSLTGSVMINNNKGNFTKTLAGDGVTEGAETFAVSLRTGSLTGPVVATTPVITVNDTSTTPVVIPTYTITPDRSSMNEGETLNFVVSTSNVPNYTKLYVTLNSSNIAAPDITGGSLTYPVDIYNNTASVTIGMVADAITDGYKSFTLSVRTGSASGPVVATTVEIGVTAIGQTSDEVQQRFKQWENIVLI